MKWGKQAVHIALKDARMLRWYVAGYLLLVTAATLDAAEALGRQPSQMFGLLVMLTGAVFLTLSIQADSPFKADAFWAIRPLTPSAVLAGKLGVAIVLVLGAAAVGQAVALQHYGIAAGRAIIGVSHSTWSYGGWLSFALIFAVLTTDLRSFLLTLVGFLVLMQFGVAGFFDLLGIEPAQTPFRLVLPFIIVSGMMIATYLYRTRKRAKAIQLALVCAAIALALSMVNRSARESRAVAPERVRSLGLRAWSPMMPDWLRPESFQVPLRLVDAKQQYGYVLVDAYAELTTSSGTVQRLPRTKMRVSLNRGAPPTLQGSAWAYPAMFTAGYTQFQIALTTPQRDALARHTATLTIKGSIEVFEPRLIAVIPLEAGSSFAKDGRRMSVVSVGRMPFPGAMRVQDMAPMLTMTESKVEFSQDATHLFSNMDHLRFVVFDPDTGLSYALDRRDGSGTSSSLVTLGVSASRQTYRLGMFPWNGRAPSAERSPTLRRAQLAIFDWESIGAYPVSVEMSRETPVYR